MAILLVVRNAGSSTSPCRPQPANPVLSRRGPNRPMPVLFVAAGHRGVAHPRTGPAPSDLAPFASACLGVWLVRRTPRRRRHRD
jgi:hypothetical protein